MMKPHTIAITVVLLTLVGHFALAQGLQVDTTAPSAAVEPDTEATPDATIEAGAAETTINTTALAADTAPKPDDAQDTDDTQDRHEARPAADADRVAALEARIEALEEARDQAELARIEEEFERDISIYGFFDLSYNKTFPMKGGLFDGLLYDKNSFFMQNLNLYFQSDISQTLSSLVEVRFSFLPHGNEKSFTVAGTNEKYQRIDKTVTDPYSSENLRMSNTIIERVQLQWEPSDYFGIIAGRFLTPFGIWNVEHSSAVILSIRPPYAQTSHIVPLAQTGLQAYGKAHFSDVFSLHYGLTLSNGRGPMDTVFDLDENKGTGMRLKLIAETPNVRFSLGTYGYMGQYTDIEKVIKSTVPFNADVEVTEQYNEYLGTLDALLEVGGLRLQSEFTRRLVRYDERPRLSPTSANTSVTIVGYPADYVASSLFLMLAYTLPLERVLNDKTLTPYISAEYVDLNDTADSAQGCNGIVGLNFKPHANVSLKTEGYVVVFPNMHDANNKAGLTAHTIDYFWGLSGQMAVSF